MSSWDVFGEQQCLCLLPNSQLKHCGIDSISRNFLHQKQPPTRDQREFSIPGILARISFIFSRSTMRFHFVILVPFSKHEILKEKIPFSSRTLRFIRQKSRLVSKLEIWKKIFSISSRTTRFRETKISISSQKIHISRCILLIIIQKQVQMYWLIQYIPGPKSMYAIWNHGSWQFELFHWHLFTGMHGLTCHPSSLSRPLSLSSNSWKDLCTHPYKRWKLYKNESQKKIPFSSRKLRRDDRISRSRLEAWD